MEYFRRLEPVLEWQREGLTQPGVAFARGFKFFVENRTLKFF